MCRDASSETEDILPEEEINVHPGHGFYGQFGNWSDTCYEGDGNSNKTSVVFMLNTYSKIKWFDL